MNFPEWFEKKYPRERYQYDTELSMMREEYRDVWDAALEEAAKHFDGYTWGPYKSPAVTIREMIQLSQSAASREQQPEDQ